MLLEMVPDQLVDDVALRPVLHGGVDARRRHDSGERLSPIFIDRCSAGLLRPGNRSPPRLGDGGGFIQGDDAMTSAVRELG